MPGTLHVDDQHDVFAASESLWGTGLLVGSLLSPALIALLDARGAFLVAGAILPVLAVAHDVLGERALGLTAVSPSLPRRERDDSEGRRRRRLSWSAARAARGWC